jgi:YVTN family beta-propeller protein
LNLRPWLTLILLLGLFGCAAAPLAPLGGVAANVSSPIALSPDGKTLWVVNPDADSITAVDTETLLPDPPIAVGREPWGVVVTPADTVVVMNRLDGSLTFLEGDTRFDLTIGPEPGGLALSLDGKRAYVTVSSNDEVAVIDIAGRRVMERLAVGRLPWAVAVAEVDGSESVVVSHRLARLRPDGEEARNDGKEAWLTALGEGEMILSPYEFGFANALEGLAALDDTLWVAHLLNKPELPRNFENTVSGALSSFSLSERRELAERRIHVNDADFSTPVNFPRAMVVSPDGRTAYLVLAGTDAVMGIDLADPEQARLIGFWPTGANPRGIVLNREGSRAYVMNFLSRDVSVLDLEDRVARREMARIPVSPETLEPEILRGKILFENASDPRLSRLGWISCGSCHIDGGVDGTTWVTPEGHRQTMALWNLEGTAPFHASATRDEVQDFEHDIEELMSGIGLAPGSALPELGEPNGGRSAGLDALAAYVLSGIRVPRSPEGDIEARARGKEVFARAGCAECHGGPAWTRSSLPGPVGTLDPAGLGVVREALRDVGTFNPATDAFGEHGFDVPSLLGLHAKAPYLHDGSARTLAQVLENPRHTAGLTLEERADLVAFLRSIDGNTAPLP